VIANRATQNLIPIKAAFPYQGFTGEDVTKPSNLTEEQITEYLERFPALQPIAGIIAEADKEGLNAVFSLAVIRLESGNGERVVRKNNLGSIKCFYTGEFKEYATIEEGAEAFVWLLTNSYLCESGLYFNGYSVEAVQTCYNPGHPEWSEGVTEIMEEIHHYFKEGLK